MANSSMYTLDVRDLTPVTGIYINSKIVNFDNIRKFELRSCIWSSVGKNGSTHFGWVGIFRKTHQPMGQFGFWVYLDRVNHITQSVVPSRGQPLTSCNTNEPPL